MASKTAILAFYLRIFGGTQRVLRLASWIILFVVNVGGLILTFVNAFQCNPIVAAFTKYTGPSQCFPMVIVFICSSPINIVTDLAMLLVPMPVLTAITLPRRQKLILLLTFSLGVFILIVDMVRVSYLEDAATSRPYAPAGPQFSYNHTRNGSWDTSLSFMWSAIDVNVSIVCACIPTLRPLVSKIMPSFVTGAGGEANKSSGRAPHLGGVGETGDGSFRLAIDSGVDLARTRDSAGQHTRNSVFSDTVTDSLQSAVAKKRANSQRMRMARVADMSRHRNPVNFNFVKMKTPGKMTQVSTVESMQYCAIVTVILFLLMGFWSSMLNDLNSTVSFLFDLNVTQTIGLKGVYWGGGYFFGPLLFGDWILRRDEHARFRQRTNGRDPTGGFRATLIVGLCIYGCGAVMYWPSTLLRSFCGLIITNFFVGLGAGVLETAANPFIILCGPRQYAETRILLAKGMQGVAYVLSTVITKKVFERFDNGDVEHRQISASGMIHVQWISLAPCLVCAALALFFCFVSLPEVCEAELEEATASLPVDPKRPTICGWQLRSVSIWLAVFTLWTHVATLQSVDGYSLFVLSDFFPGFIPPPTGGSLDQHARLDPYALLSSTAFTASQFVVAIVTWLRARHPQSRFVPAPRSVLAVLLISSSLLALPCVFLRSPDDEATNFVLMVLLYMVGGPIWPLIFAIGLRGQGARTKRAATWLTMAASGPAIWLFVMYGVITLGRSVKSLHLAFLVVFSLPLSGLVYPIFLTAVREARSLVDPRPSVPLGAADAEMTDRSAAATVDSSNIGPEVDLGTFV